MVVVGVVVVVVQTLLYDMCVSPCTPMSMQLIRVAERLGASSRASPPPLHRPNGGGQTLALCLCTGPYQLTRKSHQDHHELQLWELGCLLHVCTRELDLHKKNRSPCQCTVTAEFLLFPEQDHGNPPLHHDRDVDEQSKPALHMPLPMSLPH